MAQELCGHEGLGSVLRALDLVALTEDAGRRHNVDPALLRAQIQAESSGNPGAVSRDAQGNPIAIGISQFTPATAQQFGIDPRDPVQSIDAQARYMSQNLDKYGNVADALRDYHGGPNQANWGPKGEAYVSKITNNMSQGSPVANNQSSDDPFLAMADGVAAPKGSKTTTAPTQSATGDPLLDMADAVPSTPTTPAPIRPTPQQIESNVAPSLTPGEQFVRGAEAIPRGLYQGFKTDTDTGIKYASKGIDASGFGPGNLESQADAQSAAGKKDYNAQYGGNDLASKVAGVSKMAGEAALTLIAPEIKALEGANALAKVGKGAYQGGVFGATTAGDSDNPLAHIATSVGLGGAGNLVLGKLAQTQVGKDAIEAAGNLLSKAADATGYNVLAKKVGLPTAIPSTSPGGAAPINATGPEMASAREAAAVRKADADAMAAQAAPVAEVKPRLKLNTDGTTSPIEASPAPVAPASPVAAQPVPVFTPPQAPSTGTAGAAQQKANSDTLKAIGLDTGRPSAITGDKRTAGVEYQQSKLQTGQGEVLNAQLQKEQAALKSYGQGLVSDTGAQATSPEQVGQAVRAPLSALSDYYDTKVGGLYKTADQRAAGAAVVQPNDFGKMLTTDSNFAGKDSNVALRRGINAYAREQGIVGEDGSLQPMTVQKAEGLRQYINSQWSPENSGLIGKIKQSLDSDVGTAGGADIYSQARALHAERSNTLDNPNGISALLKESGPGGINKTVPDEKVGAKIVTMPTQQFQHVVATLKNLPGELQAQGQQALAEIKGQLAKAIYAAGDNGGTQAGPANWNAANVTRALNANRAKMAEVFTPDEISNFQTLHDAGHILQAPSAYPGAAVQGHNLAQRGMLMGASASGGAALGHAIGGYPGMVAGAQVGAVVQNKLAQAFERSAANKLQESMRLR